MSSSPPASGGASRRAALANRPARVTSGIIQAGSETSPPPTGAGGAAMLEPDVPRQFAPIEDLDPEPPGHQAHRREVIVALAILLVVVGLAGGNWWDQQRKLTHFQAGTRAAAVRDWDRARAEYAAAGDY